MILLSVICFIGAIYNLFAWNVANIIIFLSLSIILSEIDSINKKIGR